MHRILKPNSNLAQQSSVATDEPPPLFLGSISDNNICSDGKMEGLIAICEMLKTNTTLKELKCAGASNQILAQKSSIGY